MGEGPCWEAAPRQNADGTVFHMSTVSLAMTLTLPSAEWH